MGYSDGLHVYTWGWVDYIERDSGYINTTEEIMEILRNDVR